MGKGGPMAFLNKKVRHEIYSELNIESTHLRFWLNFSLWYLLQTWHPGRVQNQEEVWKREQEASKEDQKMKDLQKQIAEERAREEMMQVAEAAGVKV